MDIRPFIGDEATEAELQQAYALFINSVTDRAPGFPQPTFEAYAERWRLPTDHVGRRHGFAAWAGTRMIGLASAFYPEHENLTYCLAEVDVLTDQRRRGVATALSLSLVVDAQAEGRQIVTTSSVKLGSAAESMLKSLGFSSVYTYEWNLLDLAATDPALWDVPTPPEFEFTQWERSTPESLIAEYAEARNAVNEAPRHEQTAEWPQWTPERVRIEESEAAGRGEELWTVVAVHKATGKIAGNSSITFLPGRTDICWQDDTAVGPGFRGHGLGRALKAAMIHRIRAERPDIRFMSTQNATDNAHMIRVNRQLGYTLYGNMASFEIKIHALAERLGLADGPAGDMWPGQ